MTINIKKVFKEKGQNWLIIQLAALFLILPQWFSRSVIFGSDILFHFNRFYDIAQQIENQNFQYFMSQYGFQQSGRMVNALYGPLIAYFQGFLVWLSSSWFSYQVLSNLILFTLAGQSMYFLLKRCTVDRKKALYLSLIYLTTFNILYWVTRQGFTSWGAAVFPLCLLPIIELYEKNRFNVVQIGFLMALMFQIHLFSAVLLAIIYLICYGFVFVKEKKGRKRLFLQGFLSVVFFFLLTTNVWYGLLTVYRGNEILSPFVNQTMYKNTITFNSSYWLVTPGILLLFIIYFLRKSVKEWQLLPFFDQAITSIAIFFLVLSTNLIPWFFLGEQHWKVIEVIQFPFRFFVPFTILLFVFISRNGRWMVKERDQTVSFLKIATLLALFQALVTMSVACVVWHVAEQPIQGSRHTYLYSEEIEELKASFFNQDKSKTLSLIQKSTPDYLPIYEENPLNKYDQYKSLVINQNESDDFKKEVVNGELNVTWEAKPGEEVLVPVIIYERTKVRFNQQEMAHKRLHLTDIGTPKLISKAGTNTLVISYESSKGFTWSLLLPISTLILLVGYQWMRKKEAVS